MSVQVVPFGDFARMVVESYRAARRSPRTVYKMESVLRELGATIAPDGEEPETRHLTTAGIGRWMALACPRRASNTVIGLLGYVRAACGYAADEGLLDRQPAWRRIRPRRTRPRKARHHPASEIRRLLDHLEARSARGWKPHRLYVLTAVVAYTGLRRDEALWLRRQDLRLAEGYLEVEPHHRRELKTEASAQPVPLAPELVPILEGWLPRLNPRLPWVIQAVRSLDPWHGGGPGRRPIDRLAQAGREVGIEGLTFASLRRSWATHAETLWGLSDPQIMRVLRHTTVDTSREHYRAADLANLRSIGRRVSYRR